MLFSMLASLPAPPLVLFLLLAFCDYSLPTEHAGGRTALLRFLCSVLGASRNESQQLFTIMVVRFLGALDEELIVRRPLLFFFRKYSLLFLCTRRAR